MRGFLVSTAVTAVAFFILVKLFPSMFTFTGDAINLVAIALIFGVVNGLIGPIVRLLALPLRLMTLGLIGFVINGALLLLTAFIADQLGHGLKVGDFPPDLLTADTIVAAVLGAIILSVLSSVIRLAIPD
ncbi:MAG TPA: phage holin family protein [Candidatus Limnocylindrales bacterium]|nr:phage holin family protein [Candidatus Limnocylindrales bacterium]